MTTTTDPTHTPHEDNQPQESVATPENETPSSPAKEASNEVEELRAALARSQADYQNLIMRHERDQVEMVHYLSAKILTPLLTQLDHLERAVAIKDGIEGDAFVDGIRTVRDGLIKYLETQ